VETSQRFVVVRNLRPNMQEFRDHQGVGRLLGPTGEENSMIKLILEELDAHRYEHALKQYTALKLVGGFEITFSDNVDLTDIKVTEPKLIVHSTADVDQALADRIAFIRKTNETNSVNARLAAAKATRQIAEQTVADNAENAPAPAPDAAAPSTPTAPARTPLFNPDAGSDITAENLAAMEKPALYELAATLGLQVKKGTSLGGLRKAILLKTESK